MRKEWHFYNLIVGALSGQVWVAMRGGLRYFICLIFDFFIYKMEMIIVLYKVVLNIK